MIVCCSLDLLYSSLLKASSLSWKVAVTIRRKLKLKLKCIKEMLNLWKILNQPVIDKWLHQLKVLCLARRAEMFLAITEIGVTVAILNEAIQCDLCYTWAHANFDGISYEDYKSLVHLSNNITNNAYCCYLTLSFKWLVAICTRSTCISIEASIKSFNLRILYTTFAYILRTITAYWFSR